MSAMLQPQVILLKEGTDTSQGKAQVVSNINACTAVADTVRTTLGPRGMDKLIHDDKGNVTISNDGATIMRLLDIVHAAAKILVDIARSQDSESESAQGDAAAGAMGGRGRGGAAMRGRGGRGMRRR